VHRAWRVHHEDLHNLPFSMLADIKRDLSESLGILDPKAGVAQRAAFIVDPEGIIRFVLVTDLSVGRNPKGPSRAQLGNCRRPQQSRIRYKCERPMTLNELLDTVPAYAKDLKLNLSTLLLQQELNEQQIWGTVAASAIASRNPQVVQTVLAEAASHLSPQALEAAKSAAAVMGMNNIYYRFQHLAKNPNYATLPARLRMNVLRTHGIDPVDFELWCTAVSAINGCGACVDSHEQVLRNKGMSEESILAAVRLASVIHGLATVFDTEVVAPSQTVPA